ncbi:MAG TPA: response regulator [Fimbriimonas sp.]|nr:response regulator [Fimbriimonas sp.]
MAETQTYEPVKFLLVDDKQENLFALEELLRREGLAIVTARNGQEALEQILVNEFALAILDVQMPGMDGFELAELMRGTQRARQIPIIFLTAGGPDDARRFKGYEAGAVDFLFKPVEAEILRSKAGVFFELYRQRQELTRQRDEIRRLNETLEERVEQRTNQLLEANEQLQGFTHSVAHDFRQHIRGINVNASIVLAECGEYLGESRDLVERIKDLSLQMSRMTDDLLSFARVWRQELRISEVDVSGLAEEVALTCSRIYPSVGYAVEPEITVKADPTLMRIVVGNLLDNAFKYSQKSESPFVHVGREENGFYVKDNGIGFNMAFTNKLWMPFERLLPQGQFAGTGIGLANVSRIIKRHCGEIRVESEVGKGATFHIVLDPSIAK